MIQQDTSVDPNFEIVKFLLLNLLANEFFPYLFFYLCIILINSFDNKTQIANLSKIYQFFIKH